MQPDLTGLPRRGFRTVPRQDYLATVNDRSRNGYNVSTDDGATLSWHYDAKGELIAAAAYGIAPGAVYKVKTAH
jgi:hypothetical protein